MNSTNVKASTSRLLPSLFISGGNERSWRLARAAIYGGGIGAVAGLVKVFGPARAVGAAGGVVEIGGAVLGFALLCVGAAALRNFIARQLIWPGN